MEKKKSIFKKTQNLVTYSSILLILFFSWLQLDKSFLIPFIVDTLSNNFIKTSLILYFTSWVFGLKYDLKDEDYAMVVAPSNDKHKPLHFILIIILILIFTFLCLAKNHESFIIILNIFTLYNFLTWRILINIFNPAFEEEKSVLSGKFAYENHKVIVKYLKGNWQWYRYGFSLFILILLTILIFSNLKNILASSLNINPSVFVSICIFVYILVFEFWIWIKRLERYYTFKVFNQLKESYKLTLKK